MPNTGWFKKMTQLNSKWYLNTRQTVGCGIQSSLLALQVDLHGLHSKLSWICLTLSSDTRGWPELLPLHRQPVCSNLWFQWQMHLVGGWILKRRWNTHCTALADSVLMNSRKQKNLVLHSSHFTPNWLCYMAVLDEHHSSGIWKFRTSSVKCYVDNSHTMYR